MRPFRWAVIVIVTFASSGCDADRISPFSPSPSPAAPASPPPPQSSPHALAGVVRAGGIPVAGAKVALLKFVEAELIAFVVTDESGSYRFDSVVPVTLSGALVSVSKLDYFTDTKYISMSQDHRFDFDLERAVQISVGHVVQSQVGEARCASLGYGDGAGSLCQRFALAVSGSGSLDVSVSSTPQAPFDVTVLNPDGTIGAYAAGSSGVRLMHQVAAGSTYQVDVVHISSQTREFELLTALR